MNGVLDQNSYGKAVYTIYCIVHSSLVYAPFLTDTLISESALGRKSQLLAKVFDVTCYRIYGL